MNQKNAVAPTPQPLRIVAYWQDTLIEETEKEIVDRIHNKNVCCDNTILIEGSYNWLSARQDAEGKWYRVESSTRLEGPEMAGEIAKIIAAMEERVMPGV